MLSFVTAMASGLLATAAAGLVPISLHPGTNQIANFAGDGKTGTISLYWRENGNAWGYNILSVSAGGSLATVEGKDHFTARPHTGEDVITSVRFARGRYKGHLTTFALVADRNIVDAVPNPAATTITIYALTRSDEPVGTPYLFAKVNALHPKRRYCDADMALKTEVGFPLPTDYSGPAAVDGCIR